MTETISDKVAHVKAAKQTRTHLCHWPECPVEVPPAMWGCKPHWFKLPKYIRQRIWKSYRSGQEVDMRPSPAYLAAAKEAQNWIRENGQ